ncbi:hypothetical protein pb186bvf_010610 [Paramecium bursaria]
MIFIIAIDLEIPYFHICFAVDLFNLKQLLQLSKQYLCKCRISIFLSNILSVRLPNYQKCV